MNQVGIMGRFTRDPECRYTQSGKCVTNFTLAVNKFGDNNEADFFDCVAWEKQAENIANSCKKGHRLLVWGRLQQDKWTDQQTQQTRTAVKITVTGFSFIEPPPDRQQQQPQGGGYGQPPNPPQVGGYQQPPLAGGYQQQRAANYPPGYVPPGYPPSPGQRYPGQQPPGQQQAGGQQQTLPPGQWLPPDEIPF